MEQTNIFSTCREFLDKSQQTINIDVFLESSQIGRVLCLNSSAKIDTSNALQSEAIISGTVYTNLIYLNELGELKNKQVSEPFNVKIVNDKINPTNSLISKVEVVESSVLAATENEVKTAITLEITTEQLSQNEIETINVQDESIKTKTEKVMLNHLKNSGANKFNVMGEQSTKFNASDIVITNINASVKSVAAGTNYFTVEGEVCVNFMAQLMEEDKPIKCFTEVLTFKEEIENESILKDDLILAYVSPVLDEIELDVNAEENKTNLNLTVPLQVSYNVINKMEHEIITDAYSLNCETYLEYKNENCCNLYATNFQESRIEGNFTILENDPRIAKIVCASLSNISLTKTFVKDDVLFIEGLINTCVSYEADDDDVLISSVSAEVPFSCALKNVVNNNAEVFVSATVCQINARAKKGKDIDLDIDVVFNIDSFTKHEFSVLNKITLGECELKQEYALRAYIAPSGSTLWDISKKLKTTEEILKEQNPNVVFPLENATSIIYFNGKKA